MSETRIGPYAYELGVYGNQNGWVAELNVGVSTDLVGIHTYDENGDNGKCLHAYKAEDIDQATHDLPYWQAYLNGYLAGLASKPKTIDVFADIVDEDYIITSEKQMAVNMIRAMMQEIQNIPVEDWKARISAHRLVVRLWIDINQQFPK
jgi:hypothetical protein